jgi:hypothetical protein
MIETGFLPSAIERSLYCRIDLPNVTLVILGERLISFGSV